ncbi:MAG: hypothetical protein MUP55_00985 [Candidatus Aenigmarchaeota archaeon]|nr:hypothetical protein [Candidatus Aenigmarchaeota archaeon]
MKDEVVAIEETKITVRGSRRRTTVPARIFHKLKLSKDTMLRWKLYEDGRIEIKVIK